MFKNKKAFLLKEAVVLGFVALLLIFGFAIAYRIYSAFSGETDDGSLANFEGRLVPKIQELSKNDNKIDYTQINYFIGAAAVVGYSKDWDSEQNKYIVGLKIEKPSSCGDKACLCFFKGESVLDKNPQPYKPCIKFDKVAYFLKDTDPAVAYSTEKETVPDSLLYKFPLLYLFQQDKYKYLILTGSTSQTKSQVIYIEKYENANGDVVIYLAPINDATRDKINKKKEYIDNLNKQ